MISYGRNWLYDNHFFKSSEFEVPTIVVGNLTMGGSGKSPHIDYLLHLLKNNVEAAVLSRGYGRRSTGYFEVTQKSTAKQIGDEPLLLKLKHPEVAVAVAENRVLAIPRLLYDHNEVQVILLDDAYQHRTVRAGLNILLTTYSNPFYNDDFFPVGWLRESKKNYNRADIIIVSKCPTTISQEEKVKIIEKIQPYSYQHVYFSSISYGKVYQLFAGSEMELYPTITWENNTVLLLTAIADNQLLIDFFKEKNATVYPFAFRDHHLFDEYDLEKIKESYKNIAAEKKVIVTTEKDAVRLIPHRDWFLQNGITILVQPISVYFDENEKKRFDATIFYYLSKTIAVNTTEALGNAENSNFTT